MSILLCSKQLCKLYSVLKLKQLHITRATILYDNPPFDHVMELGMFPFIFMHSGIYQGGICLHGGCLPISSGRPCY